MMRTFFLLVFTVFGSATMAQHPILESLNAYRQPNGILLRWVIKGGQQCDGTSVFRAAGGIPFAEVYHIPGICGSFTEAETYSFFDSIPVSNTYNHYRLELGYQGFTDTVTVFFEDFGRADHLLLSDHQAGQFRILFSNDARKEATLRVFDRSGNELWRTSTASSDFVVNTAGWRAGVYLFRISGVAQKDIHGKFVVSE